MLTDFIPEDPAETEEDSDCYCCRVCRRKLFTNGMILNHAPFAEGTGTVHEQCERELFQILPVKWMSYAEESGNVNFVLKSSG